MTRLTSPPAAASAAPPAKVPPSSAKSAPTPPVLPGPMKAKMAPRVPAMQLAGLKQLPLPSEDTMVPHDWRPEPLEETGSINCVTVNQSRTMMAMSSDDGRIRVFVPSEEPNTMCEQSFVLRGGGEGGVQGIAFAPTPDDQKLLLSGSCDENPTVIRLWDLQAHEQCSDPVADEGERYIWTITFIGTGASDDQRYFATGGFTGRIKLYALFTSDRVIVPMLAMIKEGIHLNSLRSVCAVQPYRPQLLFFAVAADYEDQLRLWDCTNCLADSSSKSAGGGGGDNQATEPQSITIALPPEHQGLTTLAMDYAGEGMMRLLLGQEKGAVLVLQLDSEGRSIGYGSVPPDTTSAHNVELDVQAVKWCERYSYRFVTATRGGSVMVWDTLTEGGRVSDIVPLLRRAAPGAEGACQLVPCDLAGSNRAVSDVVVCVVGQEASLYLFVKDEGSAETQTGVRCFVTPPAASSGALVSQPAAGCGRCEEMHELVHELERMVQEKEECIRRLKSQLADLIN